MLFKRGIAISGTWRCSGKRSFLNLPIKTGIRKKKIITSLWTVTIIFYISGVVIVEPEVIKVNRIYKDIEALTTLIETLKM